MSRQKILIESSAKTLQVLDKKGIRYVTRNVYRPFSRHQLSVVEISKQSLDPLRDALGVMGITPDYTTVRNAADEDIKEPLVTIAVRYSDEVGARYSSTGKDSLLFDAQFLRLAIATNRIVHVTAYDFDTVANVDAFDADVLHVYIGAVPAGKKNERTTYSRVGEFRLGISAQEDGVYPSGIGIPIDIGSKTVAEILGVSHLFILMRLARYTDSSEERIGASVLGLIVEQCLSRNLFTKPLSITHQSGVDDSILDAFSEIYALRLQRQTKSLIDKRDTLLLEIAKIQEKLISLQSQQVLLTRQINAMDVGGFTQVKRAEVAVELEDLLTHPQIARLHVSSTYIVVETVKLIATPNMSGGHPIWIEPLRICISLAGDSPTLTLAHIKTSDKPIHPHFGRLGICYGNISAIVTEKLANYQFAELLGLMVEFLKVYTPGDTLQPVTSFERV